jgi:hypothetical protein
VRPRHSAPPIQARPSVGAIMPASMRTVVVLPAPFGPEEAEHLAARHLEREVAAPPSAGRSRFPSPLHANHRWSIR